MGETSDAIKDTAAEVASDHYARAKDATGRVVEEVKNAAAKEGLSPAAAADAVRELADKVKSVVAAAGGAASSSAKETAETTAG
jgi:hypothetical protein